MMPSDGYALLRLVLLIPWRRTPPQPPEPPMTIHPETARRVERWWHTWQASSLPPTMYGRLLDAIMTETEPREPVGDAIRFADVAGGTGAPEPPWWQRV